MVSYRHLFYFILIFLLVSISTAYACTFTVVCLNVFMRTAVVVFMLFLLIGSAENTPASWFVSVLLPLFGTIVLTNIEANSDVMYINALYLFVYLVVFAIAIIIRLYYKFLRHRKRAYFFAGFALTMLLLFFVSNSMVNLRCPLNCHSRLVRLGCALEGYREDHKGLYPSSLDEMVPVYVQTKRETICTLDSEKFIFLIITANIEEFGPYKPVPYEYVVNRERTHCTLFCHSKTHEISCKDGYPRYDSDKGLIVREEIP